MQRNKSKTTPPGPAYDPAPIERLRYFYGQLLTAEDFATEQNYHIEKRRLHNRALHGWGIVSGLQLQPGKVPWTVVVEPGYALSPLGDEIVVRRPHTVDAKQLSKVKAGGISLVAVRYRQTASRRMPVPGQSDPLEEYSRWSDDFEIGVITEPIDEDWVVLGGISISPKGRITIRKTRLRRKLKKDKGSF